MPSAPTDVLVAGLICLDLILDFESPSWGKEGLAPGSLHLIDRYAPSTGGVVANTGIALHRLGLSTSLVGKIGTDLFGQEIIKQLNSIDPKLSKNMIQSHGDKTSFSVVINPRNRDRSFLHMPGANDTFSANDVPSTMLEQAELLHFGYPPVMQSIRANRGAELKTLFERAKSHGLTTSLDMCDIAPDSDGVSVNWRQFLENVLPAVDLFMPSQEELLFMLGATDQSLTHSMLNKLSNELLDMGTAIALLKLGSNGLYLRTTKDIRRLEQVGSSMKDPEQPNTWQDIEQIVPAFEVQTTGTTGAGDCAIAGFIAAFLKGFPPKATLEFAAAVAAFCVEKPDAVSGVPSWDKVITRLQTDWPTLHSAV